MGFVEVYGSPMSSIFFKYLLLSLIAVWDTYSISGLNSPPFLSMLFRNMADCLCISRNAHTLCGHLDVLLEKNLNNYKQAQIITVILKTA